MPKLFLFSSKSPERKLSSASTPEHKGRESPASVGTARSSRRDSLNERPVSNAQSVTATPSVLPLPAAEQSIDNSFTGDLFREFQKQKQKLQETLAVKEREREELIRQLNAQQQQQDNRVVEER